VDVRLIAATNKDLKQMIAEGKFREDLYYRLAVVTIRLPQLGARGDDLILLTSYFLQEFGKLYGKKVNAISDRAQALLRAHTWIGNIRELRNVIERAVLVCESDVLRSVDLPEEWLANGTALPCTQSTSVGPLATLQDAESRHIAQVLAHTHGQIGEAAQILGVHRNTLARKIKEYQL
jgi:DNA-binding NtrC family response regulator